MAEIGILAVVSGFSGVGKGTVMNKLISLNDNYALSVSATTREPREGEVNGREYFFLKEEEFNDLIRKDALIEYACYCDHYYGTPRAFVEEELKKGRDVILEIEIQGARHIRKMFPEAVLIFIMPPSGDDLLARLKARGSENAQVIRDRLRRAAKEAEGIEDYDFIFINDDPDTCAQKINTLISSMHHRSQVNRKFIEQIRREIMLLQSAQ